jgi:ubiquitin carboxyl-terminal hydrolase 14
VDVERARKRQRRMKAGEENDAGPNASKEPLQKKKDAEKKKEEAKKPAEDTEMEEVEYKTDAQIEAERAESILAAKKEVLALVDPKLGADTGANQTGLYELRGVITHQGASADSGHYTSFVKKQGAKDPTTGKRKAEDGKWWWFNDEKVSEVDAERIQTLAGGGECFWNNRAYPTTSTNSSQVRATPLSSSSTVRCHCPSLTRMSRWRTLNTFSSLREQSCNI